jgi:YfiH family protein
MSWIEHALLREAGVPHGFGMRASPAREGVRRPVQVHGAAVLSADPGFALGEADASVATLPGVAVGVVTADCVPVLVAAGGRAVAAVHAGWRGLARGVIPRALEALAAVAPGAVLVATIGPAIGPCCYEVDAPVAEPLTRAFPGDAARWLQATGPGKWQLDLWRANTDQLVAAGVPAASIVNPRLCTGCRRDLFYSYRKEGPGLRLLTLAALGGQTLQH